MHRLNNCFYSGECHWSLASDASRIHSPRVQFQHWVERHRDRSANYMERRTCPLLWCRKVFSDKEQMLEHVSYCDLLRKGEYWCYEHQAAERFTSVGTAHLLKSLPSPAQLYQRVHTKVHENPLLTKTKRAFRKVGSKSLQKSPSSSHPSPFDSTMSHGHHEPAAEHRFPSELGDSGRSELPAPEHAFELSGDGCPAELMAWESIPYGPTHVSSLDGTDPTQSTSPSSEVSDSPLESALVDPGVSGIIPVSLCLPEHRSGLHISPSVDCWSTDFDTQQDHSDLISPLSPVSEISSPLTCGNERSSTIGTSGHANSRKLSNHYSSRPVSPLDSDKGACSTCGSTRPPPHCLACLRQPANEHAVQGHGSYSKRSAVPASTYSAPELRPLPPKQPDGLIAAKQCYLTPVADLPSKANLAYAHPMEGPLQHLPPPRGEEWSIPRLRLDHSSGIGALTAETMPSAGPPATTPEGYQGSSSSFSKSLTTFHHVQRVEHTSLESSTLLAHGLDMINSLYTSVITGTEGRLITGNLPTLFDVVMDLISGIEVGCYCC